MVEEWRLVLLHLAFSYTLQITLVKWKVNQVQSMDKEVASALKLKITLIQFVSLKSILISKKEKHSSWSKVVSNISIWLFMNLAQIDELNII